MDTRIHNIPPGCNSDPELLAYAADYLVTVADSSNQSLITAFTNSIDEKLCQILRLEDKARTPEFGRLSWQADKGGYEWIAEESNELAPGENADGLLVMQYSFYGLMREKTSDLLVSLPEWVKYLLIIDQVDNYDSRCSQVRHLVDGGGRSYEAECHDFRNLLENAGFEHSFVLPAINPTKSASGLVLATRTKKITLDGYAERCDSAFELMAQRHRVMVDLERKNRVRDIEIPTRLLIEPSSKCNFLCPKCIYPIMKREQGFADLEKVEMFLSNWKEAYGQFEMIDLSGSGEALFNKGLPDIVRLISRIMPDARMTVTSNLALLNENSASELLEAGLREWQVSFDSADKEEFHEFTGAKKFDRVVDNVRLLFRKMEEHAHEKNSLTIVAHRPFDEHYETGMQKIKDLLEPHSHAISCTPYQSLNGRVSGEKYTASEKHFYDKSATPVLCTYPWTDLVVVHSGDIRVCCSDMFDSTVSFGNVFRDTPAQIVANLERSRYKEKLMEGDIKSLYLCKDCHAPFAKV